MNISSGIYNKNKDKKFKIKVIVPLIKSDFQIVVTPKTRLHNIIIHICKKVGIDHLKSNISMTR